MKKIVKYETPFEHKFSIQMPIGAEILCVQQDQKTFKPCIFALIDDSNSLEERFFELFATEQEIYGDMGVDRKYLGTYQYQQGEFIGHLFERL